MEAPTENPVDAPATPATGPRAAIEKVLYEIDAMHQAGTLQALVVGFVKTDGGAAIQSTPMSPVLMNHLSTLLERRVAREYDRALAQANSAARPGTGAGAVPESSRQSPAAKLPRKIRRQVAHQQSKMHAKNQKKIDKQAAAQALVRRTPTP